MNRRLVPHLTSGVFPRRSLTVVLSLAAVCLLAAEAWARAGGGGGFSGGGGSGGGGSGRGSGELIYLLFWLCRAHPLIGVPVIVGMGALFVYSSWRGSTRGAQAYRGRVIRRGMGMVDERNEQQAIGQLQQRDADFDSDRLKARVATAFERIQQSWSQQDLAPIRPFVSDGIFERFSLQIEEQKDLGYQNVLQNVRVHSVNIVEVAGDELFDVIDFRISASAVDYRVSLETGRELRGSRRQERFVEYWSFLRRSGARSAPQPGLIEGTCPNCGTPIELSQQSKCASCDSLLRSGEHDWVLVEITQESEFRADPHRVPGEHLYRQGHDPTFSAQHIEDRVSVIFWRRAMADRLGNPNPLAKMASPEFCNTYSQRLQGDESGRHYLGDCAVGAVDLVGILPGSEHDLAMVTIHWDGMFTTTTPDGRVSRHRERSLRRELFVLARNAGVRGQIDRAVSSAHCPACGAPETNIASHACDFCGQVLNDGEHDWVLFEAHSIHSPQARDLVERASQWVTESSTTMESNGQAALDETPQGVELLAWTIQMALADRQLDDKERQLIMRVAKARHIPRERVQAMVDAARQGLLDVPEATSREQGLRWLEATADASLADGRLHPAEAALLSQAAKKWDYSPYDVKQLLRRRQRELYHAARRDLQDNGARADA